MNKKVNSKILLFLSVLLIFVLVVGSASAADNNYDKIVNETLTTSTDDVNTIGDVSAADTQVVGSSDTSIELLNSNNDGGLSVGVADFDDLKSEIESGYSSGKVTLSKDYYLYSGSDNGIGIQITKSIEIDGNGATIDCANNTRAFWTYNVNNITFKNINFINGFRPYGYAHTPNGTIVSGVDSHRLLNSQYCGGIYLCNTTDSQILNCNFTHMINLHQNTDNGGGAIALNGYNCLISNCNFDDCYSNAGAAINLFRGQSYNDAEIIIVYNILGSGNTIEFCTFNNCQVFWNGGAIEVYAQNNTISYSTFTNCDAGINSNRITINNNNARGAAILFNNGAPNNTIESCNVSNCTARYGGAFIFAAGNANATVNNCIFTNNSARLRAGAIAFEGENSVIENCLFIGNKANTEDGGAVYYSSKNCKILNSNFTANIARVGGAIYYAAQNCVLDNCLLVNNTATNGGAVEFLGSNCNITNCIFTGNNASEGGAVQFNGQNNYMGYCIYINNTADTDGGALCAKNTGTTVAYCNFTNNTAPTGKDFYSHGYKITFVGLKFTTLWLSNKNLTELEQTIDNAYGTSWQYPAAWQDDFKDAGFLETYLDLNQGKATI